MKVVNPSNTRLAQPNAVFWGAAGVDAVLRNVSKTLHRDELTCVMAPSPHRHYKC
ncbi:hypothetical protein [Pandoraea sp. 64-18]|uniref:hypothetical protein n=1 Tax=Pandoraea sp. 64-18 TaxID=1895806 RepID=UPI000A67BA2C|nr:hypothetical protein [Pandoraea sp. 64-18]